MSSTPIYKNENYVIEVRQVVDEEKYIDGMYELYNIKTGVLEYATNGLPDALMTAENLSLALENEVHLWPRKQSRPAGEAAPMPKATVN